MKIVTSILVFLLLQTKCLSSPIEKGRESVFSYHANIDVRNSACNHGFARWILSGQLRAQHFNGSLVIKLEDLKTSVFNGERDNLTLATENVIPEFSNDLLQPFIINKDDNNEVSLNVQPDEPLWSLNMKRGIASNFLTDYDIKLGNHNTTEKSVHGQCNVLYKVISSKENENVLHKIIDYNQCINKPVKHMGNVRPHPIQTTGFDAIKMKTLRAYTMRENNGVSQIHNIHSITQLTYQVTPNAATKQHVDQYQEFDLQEMKIIEEAIDISTLTATKDIIYEHANLEIESEFDLNQLKELFFLNYDKFMNKMYTLPLENLNMKERHYVDEMFVSVRRMTTANLKEFEKQLIEQDQSMALHFFWSFLPYIGTEQVVNYIVNYNYTIEQYDVNEQILSKALVTFPSHINFPLDDKIENFETLLGIEFYRNIPLANIAKLSFSNIIVNGVKRSLLSKENAEKYMKKFHEKFLDNTEDYENRMTYLLGLANMAEFFSVDSMLEIITNKTENNNLRTLALIGFKDHINHTQFATIWSLVRNSEEPLNFRIRALDLVLSMELTQDQFNIIVQAILEKNISSHGYFDVNDMHIANYFVTTLLSLRNAPFHNIKSFAQAALESNSFPDYSRYWVTGNYLTSYNDDGMNIGSSFQAKLIGDPETNLPNVFHFTYNSFAMSFDMGTYELYLRIQGIPKLALMRLLRPVHPTSAPDLLEIIKKFKFEIKEVNPDSHIEIVIFIDGKAVYAFQDYMDGGRKIENLLDYEIASVFLEAPVHLWYPVIDYTYFPSDLGTELSITHYMQDIRMTNISYITPTISDITYRSSWNSQLWVESHNPVISSIIGTFKYFSDEKSIKLKSWNPRKITLERQNDTLNWVWDKIMGTTVKNAQALHEYCPKCSTINEIKIENKENKITDAEYLGTKFNYTVWQITKNTHEELFPEFIKTHRSNAGTLPYLKPLLILLHYSNYMYYYKQDLLKGNVRTIDFYDTQGNFSLKYKADTDVFTNPFKTFKASLNISLYNIEPENSSLMWNASAICLYVPKYKENDELNVQILYTFNFGFYPQNSSAIIANVNRELLLPFMNPDKFNLDQPHPGIGNINVTYGNIENPDTYIFYDNLTTIPAQIQEVQQLKQYEECKTNSAGLEFVPPTLACLDVFSKTAVYNHYKMDLENTSTLERVRYMDISRKGNHELQIIMPTNSLELVWEYPYRLTDSTALYDIDIELGIRKQCIISPKQLITFNDIIIPFDDQKSPVYIECQKASSHGVTVNKINDKNIEFKMWSHDNIITGTILDNKLIVKLNDNEIHENNHSSNLEIYFMAAKVIYIVDEQIHVYYNTEYMIIKVKSMNVPTVCGFCNDLE